MRNCAVLLLAAALLPPLCHAQTDAARIAEAQVAFEKYNDCKAALIVLKEVSVAGQQDLTWILLMARVEECLNDLTAAIRYWELYSQQVPQDAKIADLRYQLRLQKELEAAQQGVPQRPMTADEHNNHGLELANAGLYDRAIGEHQEAVRLDSTNAVYHANLGFAYYHKRDPENAMQEFGEAIRLGPTLAIAHNGLGLTLADRPDLDDAIVEYKKAIDLDPKAAEFHTNLGLALSKKRQYENAMVEFKVAIGFNPGDVNARDGLKEASELDEKSKFGSVHGVVWLEGSGKRPAKPMRKAQVIVRRLDQPRVKTPTVILCCLDWPYIIAPVDSDDQGRFRFRKLPPGMYTIEAKKEGKTYKARWVRGEEKPVPFRVEAGGDYARDLYH